MLNVVTGDADYHEAVQILSEQKLNAPGYVILCNANRNDFENGVVITRSRDSVAHLNVLNKQLFDTGKWYIAQTNMDIFEPSVKDPRYEKVITHMNDLEENDLRIEADHLV